MAVTGWATVSGFFQWFGTNISLISGIVGLVGAIAVTVIQFKRNSRERKEHELKVKLMEKELNE